MKQFFRTIARVERIMGTGSLWHRSGWTSGGKRLRNGLSVRILFFLSSVWCIKMLFHLLGYFLADHVVSSMALLGIAWHRAQQEVLCLGIPSHVRQFFFSGFILCLCSGLLYGVTFNYGSVRIEIVKVEIISHA